MLVMAQKESFSPSVFDVHGRSPGMKDGGADLLSIIISNFWLSFPLLRSCEAFPGCGWAFPEPVADRPYVHDVLSKCLRSQFQ